MGHINISGTSITHAGFYGSSYASFLEMSWVLDSTVLLTSLPVHCCIDLCGLRGCKNGPDPFPGRMSYKATKPGLAVCHILAYVFYCVVVY